jgi:hypothetical protein
MDHFVVFPVNDDGVFRNPKLVGKALEDAMSPPFNFSDLFIYSHGWWTNGMMPWPNTANIRSSSPKPFFR